jgi:hypothetical protein
VGVGGVGLGVGVARARVDEINPTSAIANKSMNKPRVLKLISEIETRRYLGIGTR